MAKKNRDWDAVIEQLNKRRSGKMQIRMGSPGSAQVTRCRLLADFANLEATTKGRTLYLERPFAH